MRLRFNFLNGRISEDLSISSTTLESVALQSLPDISDPDYVAIALDPSKQFGAPEIVYLTDHIGGSTYASIERGKEGTTARKHNASTSWVHGLLVGDFDHIQGPAGPEGPAGPDFTYQHHQEIPAQMWIVNHNLDGYPNVTVVDSGGSTVEGAISYLGENTITIEFTYAFAGKAYLS